MRQKANSAGWVAIAMAIAALIALGKFVEWAMTL